MKFRNTQSGRLTPEDNLNVVDCQKACPAHTPVPDYIRLIANEQYSEAYLLNRGSNVFPGILGRICDRPCEPACRRSRLDDANPVAICRLKRVTADFKGDISAYLPKAPEKRLKTKVALIGAGPASLTVANDLVTYGYDVHLFEKTHEAGGAIRYNVPSFRLPASVLDEEVEAITKSGLTVHYNTEVKSVHALLNEKNFDYIFIGTGAPQGVLPALKGDVPLVASQSSENKSVVTGVSFLASVHYGHLKKLSGKVLVIGGGNTAMDCARTARRLGAQSVELFTAESFDEMKASPWEKEDTLEEDVQFHHHLLPVEWPEQSQRKSLVLKFQKLLSAFDSQKQFRPVPLLPEQYFEWTGDHVIFAVGQKLDFSFVDEKLGLKKVSSNMRYEVCPTTFRSSNPKILFGGDAALGPSNMITAVAQGHAAALSIHLMAQGLDPSTARPKAEQQFKSQRMGHHQWMYDSAFSPRPREKVPMAQHELRVSSTEAEVELGFSREQAQTEAARCLNCDVQTVLSESSCIECDSCIDICPVRCLTMTEVGEGDLDPGLQFVSEKVVAKLTLSPTPSSPSFITVSQPLKQTGRRMVKDENICLHCGLCAERCPTGAWDMQKWSISNTTLQNLTRR